ncbi:iron ABC transporter substrate-binding protein, partial [Burkholderia sp. Ac-20392]|nr:iron ABC transporter substrate-binding protein [Burkholderia sp. Ac-20392]
MAIFRQAWVRRACIGAIAWMVGATVAHATAATAEPVPAVSPAPATVTDLAGRTVRV